MPRTLEELLQDASVGIPDDDLDGHAEQAAYRRVVDDCADAAERGTGGGFPQPALGPASLGPTSSAEGDAALSPRRERAARELRALSALTIRGPQAVDHIQTMATSHQIDPDGAFVFACLLHLADRDEQAEYLWRFSAGAGRSASAECLYLLHLTRGELRTARHWATQITDLEPDDPEVATLATSRPLPSLVLLRIWYALHRQQPGTGLTMAAFHACAGTLSHALTTAIQSLKPEPDLDDGWLSWPDRGIAAQMRHALA
ncbi:hypothetical protein [Streptomyces cacaoi]|uniref:hypothetical protein n=1 Tax=Streptomyces cacaoi TaxID=1898 RepID=UPI0011F3572A|nr:hypothetical protein [Streptomyces cacaoi]